MTKTQKLTMENQFLKDRAKTIIQTIDTLKASNNTTNNYINELKQDIVSLKDELAIYKDQNKDLSKKVFEFENSDDAHGVRLNAYDKRISLYEDRISEMKSALENSELEKKDLEKLVKSLEVSIKSSSIHNHVTQITELSKSNSRLKSSLDEISDKYNKVTLELAKAPKQVIDIKEFRKLKQDLRDAKQKLDVGNAGITIKKIELIEERNKIYHEENERLVELTKELSNKSFNEEERIELLNKFSKLREYKAKDKEIESLKDKIVKLNNDLSESNKKLERITNEYNSYKSKSEQDMTTLSDIVDDNEFEKGKSNHSEASLKILEVERKLSQLNLKTNDGLGTIKDIDELGSEYSEAKDIIKKLEGKLQKIKYDSHPLLTNVEELQRENDKLKSDRKGFKTKQKDLLLREREILNQTDRLSDAIEKVKTLEMKYLMTEKDENRKLNVDKEKLDFDSLKKTIDSNNGKISIEEIRKWFGMKEW